MLAQDVCIDCHDCAACTSVEHYDEKYEIVHIDLSGCKSSSVSWFCCRYSQTDGGSKEICDIIHCDGQLRVRKHKCEELNTAQYIVPKGTTSITVQLHDGKFIGNLTCDKKNDCCGGIDGSCKGGASSACETTINLNTCRSTPPPTPVPVSPPPAPVSPPPTPVSPPTPECAIDFDCLHLNDACAKGVCDNYGKCKVQFSDTTTVCRGSNGSCDVEERCTGLSSSCPADDFKTNAHVCRGAVGTCDLEERCTGDSAICPADAFQPHSHTCRNSAGTCDIEEKCTGLSGTCPPDVVKTSAHVCRASVGLCDLEERCTGTSVACPPNYLKPSSHTCRGAIGACDVEEKCTGISGTCPPDALKTSGHVCRLSTGPCDPKESCTGFSGECPVDTFKPNTHTCRASAGDCDVEEKCTGFTGPCPVDTFKSNAHICRYSAGDCDVQETCAGNSPSCPVDAFKPNSHVCRNSEGPCDLEEKCPGTGSNCPGDVVKDSNTPCGPLVDRCDLSELCNGVGKQCPVPNLELVEGYVVKCGTTHYLCGVETNATHEENNSLYLGECNLGVMDVVVNMAYPSCLSQTPVIKNQCIDGKGVSNYALSQCEPDETKPKWPCLGKVEKSKKRRLSW